MNGFTNSPAGPSLTAGMGNGKTVDFPSPWLDYASWQLPQSMTQVLRWSEFIWLSNGTYRTACSRIARFFITDLKISGVDDKEAKEIREIFVDGLRIMQLLPILGDNFLCFHGDTVAQTIDGPRRLRALAGTTTKVLSEGGVYREAEFKHFGRQRLLEVEFSDGRTVLATPEHQWVVAKSSTGTTRVPTTELKGRRIERTVAPRPEQGTEWLEGVRHGFTFGDGSTYNQGKQGVANFFGAKAHMLQYFTGVGSAPREYPGQDLIKIHGVPAAWKDLPATDASAEYWYGFLCGFLAADGTVDTYGCAMLTQRSRATLEAIEQQLPRLGFAAGPLRSQLREVDLSDVSGTEGSIYQSEIFFLTLLKRFVQEQDLLLPSHRAKFLANETSTNYGRYVQVKDVRETGIVDDVYCCVEMETHSFVIEQAVLTGNCYGNLFPTITMPFKRYLQCRCGFTIPLEEAEKNELYTWKDYQFEKGKKGCPACKAKNQHVAWRIHDEYSSDVNDVQVVLLSPHEMEIGHFAYSNNKEFHWNIPSYMSSDLQKGTPLALQHCPKEVLEAVKSANGRFTFNNDVIFHHSEHAPAGVYTGGWGIPRVISNFRLAYHYQVLNRFDQAIAMDYIGGMRVISPEQGTSANGAGDPILGIGGAAFNRIVQQMVTTHRKDPASWNVSGFPLKYQLFGGEGAQLSPKDLMEFKLNEWLDATGMPAELFHGNLSVQAAPMALRLFENSWPEITSLYNNTLEWLANFMHKMLDLPEFKIELTPVRFADDLERKQVMLQLMAGNQVSPQTALKSFGIEDPREEVRKVYEWQKILAEEEKDFGEDMDQMAQADVVKQEMAAKAQGGGGMPPGGDPAAGGAPPAGGGMPMDPASMGMGGAPQGSMDTPEAMTAEADRLAQEIMGMEATARRSALINLKKTNETLHALVSSRIETMENQAATAGKQMARQGQI